MSNFVFTVDKSALALVSQYAKLEELIRVTMLQSENYLVRNEAGKRVRAMITACSSETALST